MFVKTIRVLTKRYNEFDVITPQVQEIVAQSGIETALNLSAPEDPTAGQR